MKNNTKKTRTFEVYNSVENNDEMILKLSKEEFINFIAGTIKLHKKYKGAYFWQFDANQKQRSKCEAWQSGERIFTYEGREYKYSLDISYSRKNCYCSQHLTVDGGGSLRDWKKLYKEVSGTDYVDEEEKAKKEKELNND